MFLVPSGGADPKIIDLRQSFRLKAGIDYSLLGYLLLGVVDLLEDLLTQDGWLGSLKFVRVELALHRNRYTVLLPGQVNRENAVNLFITPESENDASVTKPIDTYLEIVADLDAAGAEVVFGVVELVNAVQVGVAGQVDGLMRGHLTAQLIFRGVWRRLHRLEGVRLHQDVIGLSVLREFAGVCSDCVLGSCLLVSDGTIRADHLGVSGW